MILEKGLRVFEATEAEEWILKRRLNYIESIRKLSITCLIL